MPSVCTSPILTSSSTSESRERNKKYHPRLVIFGASGVGKTAIVHQFLYDRFPVDHCATVEELYRSEYEIGGSSLTLDILDTSGTYEFPAMRRLAISTADAFILVFAINNSESFEEVCRLRDLILQIRPREAPIVVVGNKIDLEDKRQVKREISETVVCIDWENGYLEASAKNGNNIVNVFKEVLAQARIRYALGPAVEKRRRSCPVYPTYHKSSQGVEQKRHSCTVS